MDDKNKLDSPGFTGFVLGELEGSEQEQFNAMLGSSAEALEAFQDLEETVSLLTECLEDEWLSNFSEESDSIQAMNYALGELESEMFESRVAESDALGREVQDFEDMAVLLRSGLESEWMEHESLNLDDPVFTDYAVGELDGHEARKFEAMLNSSVAANRELSATQSFVNLLSAGLEDEWRSATESSADRQGESEVGVVEVDFARAGDSRSVFARKPAYLSLAAVLTGLLVVGTMFIHRNAGQSSAVSGLAQVVGFSSGDYTWVDENDMSTGVDPSPVEDEELMIPNLRLMDEIRQPVDLASFGPDPEVSSYFGNGNGGMVNVSMQRGEAELPAVDSFSYLPFERHSSPDVKFSVKEGTIGGQEARAVMVSDRRLHDNGRESVVVQGILTFEKGAPVDMESVFPAGFAFDSSSSNASTDSIKREFDRVGTKIRDLVVDLESDGDFDRSDVRSRLVKILEHHSELGNQISP